MEPGKHALGERAPRAITSSRADCINALIRFGSMSEGLMQKLDVPVCLFEHFDNHASFSDDPGIAIGNAGLELSRCLSRGSGVPERLITALPRYGIQVFESDSLMCGFIDRRRGILLVRAFADSNIFESAWRLFEESLDAALGKSIPANGAGGNGCLLVSNGSVTLLAPQR